MNGTGDLPRNFRPSDYDGQVPAQANYDTYMDHFYGTMLIGGIAYTSLPVSQYPNIAPPTIQVNATYPGASATTVAETVAATLEEEINGVEGMLYILSQSTGAGTATVTVTFESGTDLDTAQVLVQNRVALAEPRLPEPVRRLGVSTVKANPDALLVVHLYSPDGSRDQLYISNYARLQMRDELQRLDGVGQIQSFGFREFSMTTTVDFIFDFASPNAYLCHQVLPEISERTGATFTYIPCLLGGIFKSTGNQAPMMAFNGIKGKLEYDGLEMRRFIERHNLTKFKMNENFPVITLLLMHSELFDELRPDFDLEGGDLGENITTGGIDLLSLPTGAMLKIGETALVAITGLRNPCQQIEAFRTNLLKAVAHKGPDGKLVRKAGVMTWEQIVETEVHFKQPAFRQYEKTGFATPSGKVELKSSILEDLGFDPLPYFREDPPQEAEYPLKMFTGVREDGFFQTGHRHIPEMRARHPEPEVYLNAATAKACGVTEGQWITVENQLGSIKAKLAIKDAMPDDLVRVPHATGRAGDDGGPPGD